MYIWIAACYFALCAVANIALAVFSDDNDKAIRLGLFVFYLIMALYGFLAF